VFTIFHPELDRLSREVVARHRDFDAGKWQPDELLGHQRAAIRETLRHVRERSPFYRDRLGALTDANIDSFEPADLARLPFTTKDDLRTHLLDLLSKPISDGWIFYETTGTTGRATPCPRDNVDSIVNNTALTINYQSILDAHPGRHFVGIMGPTELHSTGDTFGDVFRNLGHAVAKLWPHSPVVGFQRALEVMREFGITALVCTPGMVMSLAKEAEKLGLDPRGDFDIRFIMVVGELVTPQLLRNLGSLWNAKTYSSMYASQESSILAAGHADERLRTIPLNAYYEIVDPETGEPMVPDEHGVWTGELVITHLYQGCKPLVRYRTGDLVRMLPESATASYPAPTLEPLGRAKDMVTINGVSSYAHDLENQILASVSHCYGYQIELDRVAGDDRLTIRLELARSASDPAAIRAAVEEDVRGAYGVVPSVEFGALSSVAGTGAMVSWKAARVHDRRHGPDAERAAALALARQRDER
jgi:phenylacetate-CoA ligase